jgi:hypothetical protein
MHGSSGSSVSSRLAYMVERYASRTTAYTYACFYLLPCDATVPAACCASITCKAPAPMVINVAFPTIEKTNHHRWGRSRPRLAAFGCNQACCCLQASMLLLAVACLHPARQLTLLCLLCRCASTTFRATVLMVTGAGMSTASQPGAAEASRLLQGVLTRYFYSSDSSRACS